VVNTFVQLHIHILTNTQKETDMSNIVTAIFDWLGENKSQRERELKSFMKSEYKNDWEYAYNSLRETRQLPGAWDHWNVR